MGERASIYCPQYARHAREIMHLRPSVIMMGTEPIGGDSQAPVFGRELAGDNNVIGHDDLQVYKVRKVVWAASADATLLDH